jgi:hypothetical protein
MEAELKDYHTPINVIESCHHGARGQLTSIPISGAVISQKRHFCSD